MPSSTVENYLKAIYIGTNSLDPPQRLLPMGQLASALNVTPGTATTMVKTLAESGLVEYEPYAGVALTKAGEKLAALVTRRHRLIVHAPSSCMEPYKTHPARIRAQELHSEHWRRPEVLGAERASLRSRRRVEHRARERERSRRVDDRLPLPQIHVGLTVRIDRLEEPRLGLVVAEVEEAGETEVEWPT